MRTGVPSCAQVALQWRSCWLVTNPGRGAKASSTTGHLGKALVAPFGVGELNRKEASLRAESDRAAPLDLSLNSSDSTCMRSARLLEIRRAVCCEKPPLAQGTRGRDGDSVWNWFARPA